MSHAKDMDEHVRTYMKVGASLLVLTLVTVAASYLKISMGPAIALALLIATVKGSLVACYFMHLIDERKLIYFVMCLTTFFFFGLLFLPVLVQSDPVKQ